MKYYIRQMAAIIFDTLAASLFHAYLQHFVKSYGKFFLLLPQYVVLNRLCHQLYFRKLCFWHKPTKKITRRQVRALGGQARSIRQEITRAPSFYYASIKVRPHYAVLQNATHCSFPHDKSCSAYAANAIAFTWKNNFLQTFFGLQKLWNETGELYLIFSSNWLILFWNSLLIICHTASFDGTDNLPIEFLNRAALNGIPQSSWRNIHIYLQHGATFAARPCQVVPLCAAWHSVGVPFGRSCSGAPFWDVFTQLRSRRVVMCVVVVCVRSFVPSFVPSLIQLRVFDIFRPNLKI